MRQRKGGLDGRAIQLVLALQGLLQLGCESCSRDSGAGSSDTKTEDEGPAPRLLDPGEIEEAKGAKGHCGAPASPAELRIRGAPPPFTEEEEDLPELSRLVPEIGSIVDAPFGLTATYLSPPPQVHAWVVCRTATGTQKMSDLGEVHGGGAPPHAIAFGNDLAILLSDQDAGGRIFRPILLREPCGAAEATSFEPLVDGRDESEAVDLLALPEGGILIATDREDPKRALSEVDLSVWLPNAPKKGATVHRVDRGDVDSPRLLSTAGSRYLVLRKFTPRKPNEAERAPGGAEELGTELDLEAGIVVFPLDETGRPSASPISVFEGARFSHFEVGALGDELLISVAWADRKRRGTFSLFRVSADGTVRNQEEELSLAMAPSAPKLLARPVKDEAWVFVRAIDGTPYLGVLSTSPHHPLTLVREPGLSERELWGAGKRGLLTTFRRATDMDVSWLACE